MPGVAHPRLAFAGSVNSDIENGRIKKNVPPAQLYDLGSDLAQDRKRLSAGIPRS